MRALPLLFSLSCAGLPCLAQAASLADLDWLSGCWQSTGGEAGSEEHWLAAAGGSLLGMGRTVVKGKMVDFEFMRIEQDKDQLIFTAKPSRKPEASFQMISLQGKKVVFENATKDFPQRVIYQLKDDGSLLGRIEGKSNDKERAIDFPMQRKSCQ
ncbi:DUF6265 family protein [Undibacterium terreum]|uniref:DUF6265 domain-containing protein n=1 Tax=Undibacterium terreum TaxID=1224302 RepID=A0A916V048_9BURK|nr:DUF6265 family protein [Undibacterium terreum]GGC99091.1 hypothetical protein GCM10011396_53280 [Undibacterium terreum]